MALSACTSDFTMADVIGTWGGDHLVMVLTATGGTTEYDCAVGRVSSDWSVTPDGIFTATGRHIPGHGGPIRIDEDTTGRPARYQGSIRGRTMTLTVVLTDSAQVVGTYSLTKGRSGSVFKCV
jgi:hypothetical protein